MTAKEAFLTLVRSKAGIIATAVAQSPDLWQTSYLLDCIALTVGTRARIRASISLQRHDAEGWPELLIDVALKNSALTQSSGCPADEPVVIFPFAALPDSLTVVVFELRPVAYDFETPKPIDELGVWEPEEILTGLQIAPTQ